MKRTLFCSFLVIACMVVGAHGFEEEPPVSGMVQYNIYPEGGGQYEGEEYLEYNWNYAAQNLTVLVPPETFPPTYSFVTRGTHWQSDRAGQVGSGSSCTLRGNAFIDGITVESHAQLTRDINLSHTGILFDYYWDGDLKLTNSYFNPDTSPFDITFQGEGEGFIELGYQLSIHAYSEGYWSSIPELGGWELDLASEYGTVYIDSSGTTITQNEEVTFTPAGEDLETLLLEINGGETFYFGPFVEPDLGKEYHVEIMLDTWVRGAGFEIAGDPNDIFLLSSNFYDTLGCEVTGVPEPSTAILLCCLASTALLLRRRFSTR